MQKTDALQMGYFFDIAEDPFSIILLPSVNYKKCVGPISMLTY